MNKLRRAKLRSCSRKQGSTKAIPISGAPAGAAPSAGPTSSRTRRVHPAGERVQGLAVHVWLRAGAGSVLPLLPPSRAA